MEFQHIILSQGHPQRGHLTNEVSLVPLREDTAIANPAKVFNLKIPNILKKETEY